MTPDFSTLRSMPAPVRRCLKRYGFSLAPVEDSIGLCGIFQTFWRGKTVKLIFIPSLGTISLWAWESGSIKNGGKIEDCCTGIREFMEKLPKVS